MSQPDCIGQIIALPYPVHPVLAAGAWFKNTLCITSGDHAYVSRSVGDLDTPEVCLAHEQTARDLLGRLPEKPRAIVCDLHPDFHSSRFAAQLAEEFDVPLLAVQHHHAHIAAVCAEHGEEDAVLGLALDGVGLGTGGGVWGGELLRVEGAAFERLAHLRALPLPGGDRAAREPWRMASAVLHELGRNAEIVRRYADEPAAATLSVMLQRGLNCPRTSSMGRTFDAAAGLLGLSRHMLYEAQAAIALEQAATRHISVQGSSVPLADGWQIDEAGCLDLRPLFAHLADNADDAELGAVLFHSTLIAGLSDWVERAAQRTGIRKIACGGGCFFNRLLNEGLRTRLEAAGLTVLYPRIMPPGDTAIALGQAWVAVRQEQGAA